MAFLVEFLNSPFSYRLPPLHPHWKSLFLYAKINMFVGFTKFLFHIFLRYEIHIQAFWDFIWCKSYHFRSSSSHFMNEDEVHIKNKWYIDVRFSRNKSNLLFPIFTTIICSQDVPIFSWCFEAFWYNKKSKYGILRVQKSRNHENDKHLCLK